MSKNKLINFINFHFQKIVFVIILIILISIFLYRFIPDYIESKKPIVHKLPEDFVYEIMNNHPELLEFDDNNKAIIKMDTLYIILPDEVNPLLDPIYNDEFDQCAGYIIINKNSKGNYDIDTSHICDMIDY
jgi:competence protein ComGC